MSWQARGGRASSALVYALILCATLTLTACGVRSATTIAAPPVTALSASGTGTPASPSSPHAATPKPANRCAASDSPQRVIVSLAAQHMWLCQGARTVEDNPITSGKDTPDTTTPTGHFFLDVPARNTTLKPNTGETYFVKYWIPFESPDYGFHDSSWQKFPYGSSKYKTDGSHGCIHMPLAAIAFMFNWMISGMPVDISA